MDENVRTSVRRKYNSAYLAQFQDAEIHYVYALVDMEKGHIGYIGVTNDPTSRLWQHLNDAKTCPNMAKSQWINSLLDTPEMIIYASCTKREHAEMIERALINQFDVSNTNHNFKFVGWRTEDSDRDPDPPPDDIPY